MSEDAALALMLPREFPPLRFPITAGAAGQRTALAKLLNRSTSLCLNDFMANLESCRWGWALFRSPSYPLWEYRYIPTATAEGFLWQWEFKAAHISAAVSTTTNIRQMWTRFDSFVRTTSSALPFDVPIGVLSDDLHGDDSTLLYVPSDCYLRLTNSGADTTFSVFNLDYNIYPCVGATSYPDTIRVAVNGSGAADPACAGWLKLGCIVSEGGSGNSGTFTLSVVPRDYPFLCLYPSFAPIEYTNSQLLYSDTRINGSSILISNTTPHITTGGVIRAARLPMTLTDSWGVGSLTKRLAAASGDLSFSGKADKGIYSWTLPDEFSSAFTDYTALNNYAFPVFRLSDSTMVNYMQYDGGVVSLSGAGTPVQTFALEYCQSIEFRTAAQFMTIDHCRILPDEMAAATMAAGDRQPFVENPLHWATLVSTVRRLGKMIYPTFRPYVLDAYDKGTKYIRDRL